IALPGKKPGVAAMMNVSGNSERVNEFLSRLIREATAAKLGEASKERIAVGTKSIEATVLTFPPDETHPTARKAYYIAHPQLLLATDQKYLAELLLRKLAGDTKVSLATQPEYQAIMRRCVQDAASSGGSATPQVRFFGRPLEAGEAIRSMTPASELNARSPFVILAKQGFDGVKGVGGTLDFTSENFEAVYRVKVYVPNPPTLALKMLAFNNVEALTPPSWVGPNANRYTTLNVNALTAFNNFGPLFDEFLETEGAWNDVLASLEQDRNGPQVNLSADLFANFGRQFTSTNAIDPTRADDGEKYVVSLNILEGKEETARETLRRMFDSDPDFVALELDGRSFWQYAPNRGGAESTDVSPRRAPTRPTRPTRPSERATANAAASSTPGPEAEIIEGAVFGVANGCLFVSNDVQYLLAKLKETEAGAATIMDSPEHAQVLKLLASETRKTRGLFLQGYARNVDGLRANYELFRLGKTPEGKTISSKLLKAILSSPDQRYDSQKLDGSALPPFDEANVKIGASAFFG
ncbi:MAG: hypothetical protein IJO46_14025, partial [Thermoguttaceae bacterium]|nr:hypothetical protein [Thermoguttaceae bacterium]